MTMTARGCAALLGLLLISACDSSTEPGTAQISGAWALDVDSICEGVIVIDQEGNAFDVTGWIGGDQCPYFATGEGSGTIDRNTITFGVGLGESSAGGLGNVAFMGSVASNGDQMSGTWSASGFGGQWTATRTQVQ